MKILGVIVAVLVVMMNLTFAPPAHAAVTIENGGFEDGFGMYVEPWTKVSASGGSLLSVWVNQAGGLDVNGQYISPKEGTNFARL